MHANPKSLLETIADAIVEAQKPRVYGLYDYSGYLGDMPPHVIRHEVTGEVVERYDSPELAQQHYERLSREHVAREVIHAFMDWMQNDLFKQATKSGLRP